MLFGEHLVFAGLQGSLAAVALAAPRRGLCYALMTPAARRAGRPGGAGLLTAAHSLLTYACSWIPLSALVGHVPLSSVAAPPAQSPAVCVRATLALLLSVGLALPTGLLYLLEGKERQRFVAQRLAAGPAGGAAAARRQLPLHPNTQAAASAAEAPMPLATLGGSSTWGWWLRVCVWCATLCVWPLLLRGEYDRGELNQPV